MKLGIGLPSFASDEFVVPPRRLEQYAQVAEENGFDSLWTPEHLVKPETYYTSWMDPLTTLSCLAGATEQVTFGTSILVLTLRNPVMVAKRANTIQHLSEERLTLGVGMGYNRREFEAANVPYKERSARFTEALELLYRLLNEESVTFDGEFYQIDALTIEPQPGQSPRILLGGSGIERDGDRFVPRTIKERLPHADGWISPGDTEANLASDWNDFSEYLENCGEDPQEYSKVGVNYVHLVPQLGTEAAVERQMDAYKGLRKKGAERANERYLQGSIEDIREGLELYDDLGYDELVVLPSATDLNELEQQLEYWPKYFPKYV